MFLQEQNAVQVTGRVSAGIEPDSLAAKNGCAIPPLGVDEVTHTYGILYIRQGKNRVEALSLPGCPGKTGFEPALTGSNSSLRHLPFFFWQAPATSYGCGSTTIFYKSKVKSKEGPHHQT